MNEKGKGLTFHMKIIIIIIISHITIDSILLSIRNLPLFMPPIRFVSWITQSTEFSYYSIMCIKINSMGDNTGNWIVAERHFKKRESLSIVLCWFFCLGNVNSIAFQWIIISRFYIVNELKYASHKHKWLNDIPFIAELIILAGVKRKYFFEIKFIGSSTFFVCYANIIILRWLAKFSLAQQKKYCKNDSSKSNDEKVNEVNKSTVLGIIKWKVCSHH
jgi:hypothetical protein